MKIVKSILLAVGFYVLTAITLFLSQMKVQAYPIDSFYNSIGLIFAIAGVLFCLLVGKNPKRFGVCAVIASIVIVIGARQVAGIYTEKGFNYAKRYATEVAQALQQFHDAQGRWPNPGDNLPGYNVPPADMSYSRSSPCETWLLDPVMQYCRIAGFKIIYFPRTISSDPGHGSGDLTIPAKFWNKNIPFLAVTSRSAEMESVYNFDTKQWEDQPRHGSPAGE